MAGCPYGTYQSNYLCYPCDGNCKSCVGGPSKCLECAKGYFYLNNQCLETCPSEGFYKDSSSGLCTPCQSPCYSCDKSTISCTSCISTSFSNLLFDNKCYSSCPDEVSVN
jgi:hypothetical protein